MDDPTPTVDAPTTSPIRFRRTRIALSVFFGLVAIALVGLWVRSYWKVDRVHVPTDRRLLLSSQVAIFRIAILAKGVNVAHFPDQLFWISDDAKELEASIARVPSWGWRSNSARISITFPIWFVAALCVYFAWAPWYRYRFSLRTMLIATTLVAVVLGLGVWLAR